MTSTPSTSTDSRQYLYLAGIGVTHSFAYALHNLIAKSLDLPWEFINKECATVEDVVRIFRLPSFAGGVVTMPFKQSIMPHLDELDDLALTLGACNNVYLTPEGKLRGTNTDWRGIKGCLLSASSGGKGKPALIIGAGGASRAAVYALSTQLGCSPIYIINRDAGEVATLLKASRAYAKEGQLAPELIHVQSVAHAESLSSPFYIVGTVPDFEPQTVKELEARAMLTEFLDREGGEKGVLLDMCFKPRSTRHLKLGRAAGWATADGTGIIGHQLEEQWRLWAGQPKEKLPLDEAWKRLAEIVETHPGINFNSSGPKL
jgi:quinate dehydrogenase